MADIVFKAEGNGNVVRAATATQAVRQFLARYKNRQFSVMELRDGVFKAVLSGAPSPAGESYFYRSFRNRAEARAFCDDVTVQ